MYYLKGFRLASKLLANFNCDLKLRRRLFGLFRWMLIVFLNKYFMKPNDRKRGIIFFYLFWTILDYSKLFWAILRIFELFWTNLTYSELFWAFLSYFDQFSTFLSYSEPFWTFLSYSELLLTIPSYYELFWAILIFSELFLAILILSYF